MRIFGYIIAAFLLARAAVGQGVLSGTVRVTFRSAVERREHSEQVHVVQQVGTAIARRGDSVEVEFSRHIDGISPAATVRVTVPTTDVERLAGRESFGADNGAAFGALIGAAIGVVASIPESRNGCDGFCTQPIAGAALSLAGALIGIPIGAVIGTHRHVDSWKPIAGR
jgi:hypothetical protein